MATAGTGSTGRATRAGTGSETGAESISKASLEDEVSRLRDDVAKLTAQLAATGEHSYSAARRAASEGAEQLRLRGEAAVAAVKSNASDLERQVAESVREQPMRALAIAAGIGYFLALLSRR